MAIYHEAIQAPRLDHDAMMLKRHNYSVSACGKRERRIVANLIAHMAHFGWRVDAVFDGDETTDVSDAKSAMELIFNLDDAYLWFDKGMSQHAVRLIMGNDLDIVSDWGYSSGDKDGFNAAMEKFDTEDYA